MTRRTSRTSKSRRRALVSPPSLEIEAIIYAQISVRRGAAVSSLTVAAPRRAPRVIEAKET